MASSPNPPPVHLEDHDLKLTSSLRSQQPQNQKSQSKHGRHRCNQTGDPSPSRRLCLGRAFPLCVSPQAIPPFTEI
jgi:ribosomal protein S14